MYHHIILLFCVFIQVQPYTSFQKGLCGKDDNNCITKAANNIFKTAIDGDASANIKPLDPLIIKRIEGKFGAMNYDVNNNTLVGLKKCDIIDSQFRLEQNSAQIKLLCPHLHLYGIYKVSGYLIIVPIEGKGDYNLEIKDYHIHIDTETKLKTQDGGKYLSFKTFKVTGDVRGGMSIDLKNLFNGQNKELADAALKFANEQWKPVTNQFQGPILNAYLKKVIKNMNKYLKTVPIDTLWVL